jgi:hypothetical protein
LTFGGDEKRFRDLLSAIEKDRFIEDGNFVSKVKGKKRELKILECSLNFDTKGTHQKKI